MSGLHLHDKNNTPHATQPQLTDFSAFVDLVKAFDTVNHDMMLKILERYGAPPKMRSAISRIYHDLKIFLKIGKIEKKLSQTVGLRQGDCMAPVLFQFLVMAIAKTLEK